MDQPSLWLPAVEAVTIGMQYRSPGGWEIRLAVRRSGQEEWLREEFELLHSDEAVDVVCATLWDYLG